MIGINKINFKDKNSLLLFSKAKKKYEISLKKQVISRKKI